MGATVAMNYKRMPLEGLDADTAAEIEVLLERRTFRRKETIFAQGQERHGVFWLRRGSALLQHRNREGRYGLATPVYWGVWGASSQIDHTYHANLVAVSNCEVSVFPPALFSNPRYRTVMTSVLSQWSADDFRWLTAYLASIYVMRADLRIRRFLRLIYDHALRDPERNDKHENPLIPWPFTVTDLSDFVQLSRPHASSIFNQMVTDGQIILANRQLSMTD